MAVKANRTDCSEWVWLGKLHFVIFRKSSQWCLTPHTIRRSRWRQKELSFLKEKKLIHLKLCITECSVAQSCLTLCNPMNGSTPGLPVHHQHPEFIQTHVHWVSDAIQPFNLLSSPSPPAFNLSQHQDLFKWVSSSHQVAKVLEFQLQSCH